MKKVFRRPSPAMVVAIVALIAALGGTAVAGGALNKKKVKNISNNQITQRAPGLSVASAKSADNATTATRAQGPVGWAAVSSTGVLLAGNNVSQGNITQVGNFYCFSGLSFPVSDAQATPDYFNGTPQFQTQLQLGIAARGGIGGTGCPAPTQVFVHGVRTDNDTLTTVAFHILFLN
jgi:hypothetical protein